MVPDDWKKFIAATVDDVRAGRIPMSRIDDAVSRIIRVKLRSGLFDASPATGPHPDADGAALAGGARARARGGAQVARAAEERSRRAAAQAQRQDPRRRQGRRQPADADRRLVADLAGRQDQQRPIIPTPTRCSRRCARRSAPARSTTAPTARAWTCSRYSAIVMVAAEKPYAERRGRHRLPGNDAPHRALPRRPRGARARQRQGRAGRHRAFLRPPGRRRTTSSTAPTHSSPPGCREPKALGLPTCCSPRRNGRAAYDFTGRLSFDWPAGDCLPQQGGVQFRRGYGLVARQPDRQLGRLPEVSARSWPVQPESR